jgi:hypothetical protein
VLAVAIKPVKAFPYDLFVKQVATETKFEALKSDLAFVVSLLQWIQNVLE